MTSQKMVKTYGIIIKSGVFLDKVIGALDDADGDNLTVKNVSQALQIKQIDETEVFEVSYTSYDCELTNNVLEEISIVAETELKSIIKSEAAKVNIIEKNLATTPDSKHVVRNSLIGFVVGIVASMVVIFLFNQFDVVIHNKKKIEDNFDIPVLGVIPRQGATVKTSGGGSDGV
jgi:capsular polysaccharide biosynthesis protein